MGSPPAITAARGAVFGTVIFFCALLLAVLLAIGLFRLLWHRGLLRYSAVGG